MTESQYRRFEATTANIDDVLREIRLTGFCVVESLLSESFVSQVRGVLKRILYKERASNKQLSGHQRILHLLAKHGVFSELLCNPFALALWRRSLGHDMICSTLTANALWPRSTEQYWHADYPYWTMPQPFPTYQLSGQVIWMIDAFTEKNGGTAGIAGSHLAGCLPDLERTWTDRASVLTGPPGSAIFSDGAWWHTSRPNSSRSIRFAVLASYIRSYCVTQEDMEMQLSSMAKPSPMIKQLLGAKRYVPTRGFPY